MSDAWDFIGTFTPSIYAAFSDYWRAKEEEKQRESDARFFVAARVVKHMDVAIDVWEETRSQQAAWEAWLEAVRVEFPEDNEDFWKRFDGTREEVWTFVRAVAAQLALEYFRPTVWDHLRNPSV